MPREKSVILTPTQKKEKVADLKAQLKTLKAENAERATAQKAADKAYKADTATRTKATAAANASITKLTSELAAVNPPKGAAAE